MRTTCLSAHLLTPPSVESWIHALRSVGYEADLTGISPIATEIAAENRITLVHDGERWLDIYPDVAVSIAEVENWLRRTRAHGIIVWSADRRDYGMTVCRNGTVLFRWTFAAIEPIGSPVADIVGLRHALAPIIHDDSFATDDELRDFLAIPGIFADKRGALSAWLQLPGAGQSRSYAIRELPPAALSAVAIRST